MTGQINKPWIALQGKTKEHNRYSNEKEAQKTSGTGRKSSITNKYEGHGYGILFYFIIF
jgi:hypothetical protein